MTPPHDGFPMPAPPMQGASQETREAYAQWEMAALRREIADLKQTVDGLTQDKEKAMRWGIMALGAAVLGMGTWIFNLIASRIGN